MDLIQFKYNDSYRNIKIFVNNYNIKYDKIDIIRYDYNGLLSIGTYFGNIRKNRRGNYEIRYYRHFSYKLDKKMQIQDINTRYICDRNDSTYNQWLFNVIEIKNNFDVDIYKQNIDIPSNFGINILNDRSADFFDEIGVGYDFILKLIILSLESVVFIPFKSIFIIDSDNKIKFDNIELMDDNFKDIYHKHFAKIIKSFLSYKECVLDELDLKNRFYIRIIIKFYQNEVDIGIIIDDKERKIKNKYSGKFFLFELLNYTTKLSVEEFYNEWSYEFNSELDDIGDYLNGIIIDELSDEIDLFDQFIESDYEVYNTLYDLRIPLDVSFLK